MLAYYFTTHAVAVFAQFPSIATVRETDSLSAQRAIPSLLQGPSHPFLLLAVACWLMLTLCCVRDQLYVKEIADLCMFHEESMEAVSVRLLGPLAWCAWLTVLCRRIISFAVQTGVAVDKLK